MDPKTPNQPGQSGQPDVSAASTPAPASTPATGQPAITPTTAAAPAVSEATPASPVSTTNPDASSELFAQDKEPVIANGPVTPTPASSDVVPPTSVDQKPADDGEKKFPIVGVSLLVALVLLAVAIYALL